MTMERMYQKNKLSIALVVFSNAIFDGNDDLARLRSNKTPNCDFRLLNVIFDDNVSNKFQATGTSMNWGELDPQNGANEFTFWDLVAEFYNNKEHNRFDEVL
jgi:hypothetical protein